MKNQFLVYFICTLSVIVNAQDNGLRILPEAGISKPLGDFNAQNGFAKEGLQVGLHLDKFWGNFGIGIYGGINNNGIDYKDNLPPTGGLISSKPNRIAEDSWKQLLVEFQTFRESCHIPRGKLHFIHGC